MSREKIRASPRLTSIPLRAKIKAYPPKGDTPWIKRTAPPRVPPRVKIRGKNAGMVELVDSVDLGSTAQACRFESCCPHQSNIIRTRSSLWEMGSDYLFSSGGLRKSISETVSSSVRNQSPEDHGKRNRFRRILLWIRK